MLLEHLIFSLFSEVIYLHSILHQYNWTEPEWAVCAASIWNSALDSLVHVNYFDKKIIYIYSVLNAIRATKKYLDLKTDHYSGGMTGIYYELKKKKKKKDETS